MTIVRRVAGLLLMLVLFGSLAACGGKAVTFAEVPLHPAAVTLQEGSHPMAESIARSFRQSLGQGNVKLDLQMYTLPAETAWEDVKGFYEEQITGDWKAEAKLAQNSDAFKTIGWARGAFAGEQGLVVGYGPALLGNPPFLMVALFSE